MCDLRNTQPVIRVAGLESAPDPKYLRHSGRIIRDAMRKWTRRRGLSENNDVAERGFGSMNIRREQ